MSIALAHINQEPEPLSTNISAPARELIRIALRKDPATRYADGNEFTLAISAVRLGKRPPQPKSAPLTQRAPEPSPSASTEMLGNVAQPTTIHPAAGTAPHKESKGGSSFLKGLGITLLLAAVAGGGYAAYHNLSDNEGESEPSSTPETSVVTEYRDPTTTPQNTPEEETEEAPAPVTVTETEPQESDQEEAPRTTTHRETPTRHSPTHQEQPPAVPTQQNPQDTHVETTPELDTPVNSQANELPGDLADLITQEGD